MEMNLKIKNTETQKITLSEEDMLKVTLEYLQKKYGLTHLMIIEDEKIMHEVEYIGSHKWRDWEELRDVNPIDNNVLTILKDLNGDN